MLNISPKKQLILYLCWLAVFFFVAVVISLVVMHSFGTSTTSARLQVLSQDLLVFVFPVVATLLMTGGKPFAYVGLCEKSRGIFYLLTILIMIFQVPAMNAIIKLNAMIPLPEWMATSEEAAMSTTALIFGDYSATDFVISVLLVGFLAAFSEEFLFRGFLTRLLSNRYRRNAAIWIVALIFSFVHFQFSGFVPRVLLGALFGYMAWWSGTLWTGVLAHFVNNVMAVAAFFLVERYGYTELNDIGAGLSYIDVTAVIVSVVVSFALLSRYALLARR